VLHIFVICFVILSKELSNLSKRDVELKSKIKS